MVVGIAIDPGKHGCGVAVFRNGYLEAASYVGGLGGQIHTLLQSPHLVDLEIFQTLAGLDAELVIAPRSGRQTRTFCSART